LKDMRPDSQSFSSSIGDNKTVTIDFTSQIGGPRQNDVGLFMAGVTQANTVDATGPTFSVSEVQSASQHVAGTITGDLVFKFNEPVQFDDGTTKRDLQTSDFILTTGVGTAMAGGFRLTPTTDYVLADNVGDKTFVLRYASAGITKVGGVGAEDLHISGGMASTNIKDLLGNAITAGETGMLPIVDSAQYGA